MKRYSEGWAVGGILALALVLRLHQFAAGLSADEVWFLHTAQLPWPAFWAQVLGDWIHPPLAHLMLRGWVALWGASAIALRAWPLLGGVLGVAACYACLRTLAGRAVGGWAALLLALSAYHVDYSQEARGYPWLLVFLALSLWALWRWHQQPASPRRLWGYALAAFLMVHTHYYGWLALAAQGLWVLAVPAAGSARLPWGRVAGGLVLTAVPWAAAVWWAHHTAMSSELARQTTAWLAPPTFVDVVRLPLRWNGWLPQEPARWSALVGWGLLALWGSVAAARTPAERAARALVLLVLLVPVTGIVLVSQWWKPVFTTHYFLFLLPAYYGLVSWGAWRLPRGLRVVAVAGLLVSSSSAYVWWLGREHHVRFDAVADWLAQQLPPGAMVITENVYGLNPLAFYGRERFALRAIRESYVRIAPQTCMLPAEVALPLRELPLAVAGRSFALVTYTGKYEPLFQAVLVNSGSHQPLAQRTFLGMEHESPKALRVTVFAPRSTGSLR